MLHRLVSGRKTVLEEVLDNVCEAAQRIRVTSNLIRARGMHEDENQPRPLGARLYGARHNRGGGDGEQEEARAVSGSGTLAGAGVR